MAFSADEERLVSIKEAASEIGVSTGTLRMWEAQGLAQPERDERGWRRYSPADLHRLAQVLHMRKVQGLSASAIRFTEASSPSEHRSERGAAKLEAARQFGHDLKMRRLERRMTLKTAAERSG